MKNIKILLAGGGTGGHIYPALAIAKHIENKYPGSRIEFVGSRRGLEKDIIPKHGYKLHMLSVGQLHSSVGKFKQIKTLFLMPFVFLQAFWILIKFRPSFVFGVGGYASGPLVLVASLMGFKTAIWEANVQPGITNKFLAKFVDHCFVVFEDSLKFFPSVKTKCAGYPVRQEFEDLYFQKRAQWKGAGDYNATPNDPKTILIFGGSQGAAVFNRIIPKVSAQFPEMQFVLQTGTKNYPEFEDQALSPNLKVLPFLDPILEHYLRADLIVSRSGAGAIAELSALGASCLFVPFPRASDDHQRKNAEALLQRKASDMILEDDFTSEQLTQFLQEYTSRTPSQTAKMQKQMLDFFKPGATQTIVATLIDRG